MADPDPYHDDDDWIASHSSTELPPWPSEPPDEWVARPITRRFVIGRAAQFAVVLTIGILAFVGTVGIGRSDSAMVFVGLPTLLALAITLGPRARSLHGLTFRAISLGLLVAAVLVREGVICLIFAAPLVYAIGHGMVALFTMAPRRRYAIAPVVLLIGLEGLVPGLRVEPQQTVTAVHTVALAPAAVARRIAAGPDFARVHKPWLLAMVPLPGHVLGAGVDPGDGWEFTFHGDSHGPGGDLVIAVASHTETATGGSVTFRPVSDTSVVTRWLAWSGARLDWHAVPGGTEVTLTLQFVRRLDPSWYFGPLEQVMAGAGAGVILDALGLPA